MAIIWRDGRMVGAEGHGVRLDFEAMPQEGVEALRMLRSGDSVGVLWFAPFSVYAEVTLDGQRVLFEDYLDADDLLAAVLAALAGAEEPLSNVR